MQAKNMCVNWRALFAALFLLAAVFPNGAQAFTLNVVGQDGGAVGAYRYIVQEDRTFHQDPAGPVFDPAAPDLTILDDVVALNFHRSYMPVVAKGEVAGSLEIPVPDPVSGWYFVSVLPRAAGQYTMGGALVKPGQGSVTVTLNTLPLPTAQISVFVFEDTRPINNIPDLPEEQGLAGFQIIVEEAGGRFGASGGQVSQDAFGNPLGSTYLYTCDAAGQNPGTPGGTNLCLDAEGNPVVDQEGPVAIVTDANGVALIKNLPPAKYGIRIDPPEGQGWIQTSTIEGTKTIDAWVKANEPPYFTEFGPAGHHVEFGFVRLMDGTQDNTGDGLPDLHGASTITGQVVSTHMSRPPDYTMYRGAVFPDVYVGLNDMSIGRGVGIYAVKGDAQSNFSIPNVPPGNYQLVVWDNNLDIVFAASSITVNPDGSCSTVDGTCSLGQISVFDWFAHLRGRVFYDENENGFFDEGEFGQPSTVNVRWRDGTIYASTGTEADGSYAFDETFPFFNWLVAEVDFATMKATGMTAVADAGGFVDTSTEAFPGFGRLTPQPQDAVNLITGDNLSRTETGEVLTQAFQAFLGQTNIIDWGKKTYVTGENGGISGMVFYKTTRAEPNPEDDVGLNHEPGIPGVEVNLYEDFNADGEPDGPAVATTVTDSFDDSLPDGCPGDPGDLFYLGGRCYDGLRNFNQVRPGVFDGGYAFPGPLPVGTYIVEAVPPPHYEIVRAEDMNVAFGETYVPADAYAPMMMAAAYPLVPPCVGDPYVVDPTLALFPDANEPHPYYDPDSPLYQGGDPVTLNTCDRKQIQVAGGRNAAVDFFMFTEVPIAANVKGMILNDLASEFDPNNPNFGEKFALPFLPVSFRDWGGREIIRVYSDQYGQYNALVPSTFTTNVPNPSGMGPNMLIACMNDPLLPDGTQDPYHDPQYTHFCYTFQYMPGATTYLDTPVEPIAAFAGQNQAPLDCDFVPGTPVIWSVTGGGRVGPYVLPGETLTLNADPLDTDHTFGAAGTVALNGTPLEEVSWGADTITGTVPTGMPAGQYQLTVTTAAGFSTVMGATVLVGPYTNGTVREVAGSALWPSNPLQEAIDMPPARSRDVDVILVGPGVYDELVVMWKPVKLLGAGAPSTVISAVKAPGEKLQAWRDKVNGLVEAGSVDILPGQALNFDLVNNEPGFLNTAEGPGIMVLARNRNSNQGGFGSDPNATIANLTVRSSDIGGGIYVNGYARYLEIANNRIMSNAGIYGGGITVGHPFIGDGPVDAENDNLYIHNNHITQNGSRSGGAGGGLSLYTGADAYLVENNYICGNFTKGVGAGIGHQGLSDGGRIVDNRILFNQSFNQLPATRPAAGGIAIEGFTPPPGELSPGAGSVIVNGNLLQGNVAGAGDGGGIELYMVNGEDVRGNPKNWFKVDIFNNMIVNNLAGIAGGGISIKDAVKVNILHNTIANNDSTATAGELIDPGTNSSSPEPAGVVFRAHSGPLAAQLPLGPQMTYQDTLPRMVNNFVWHNRSFYYGLDPLGNGALFERAPLYWDLAVLDLPAGVSAALTCSGCSTSDEGGPPAFAFPYVNTGSVLDIIGENALPLTAAALDEGGNWIDVRIAEIQPTGDYHITSANHGGDISIIPTRGNQPFQELLLDYDIEERPNPGESSVDIGADEFYPAP